MRTLLARIGLTLLPAALGSWLAACQEAQPVEPDREPAAHLAPDATGAAAELVRVFGTGKADVIDENGDRFSASIAVSGVLAANGSRHGTMNVVFDRAFSEAWGAEPGVTRIHFRGKVSTITSVGGNIVLAGTATETDYAPGREPLVFNNEPFHLVIDGRDRFVLQWCELPPFAFEVKQGSLVTMNRMEPSPAVSGLTGASLAGGFDSGHPRSCRN